LGFPLLIGLSLPPQEFYDAVEKGIGQPENSKHGNVPRGTRRRRIAFWKTPLYLRMMRERLAFDTCASPFGNTFFFSCRTVHSPPVLRLWHLAVAFVFFVFVYSQLVRELGLMFATSRWLLC